LLLLGGKRLMVIGCGAGGKAAAFLHMARTICRRAERSVLPLVQAESTNAAVGIYLNRLSDYLFVAARTAVLSFSSYNLPSGPWFAFLDHHCWNTNL
jgi:ATP:cob(I)alamin adenosyltransferase